MHRSNLYQWFQKIYPRNPPPPPSPGKKTQGKSPPRKNAFWENCLPENCLPPSPQRFCKLTKNEEGKYKREPPPQESFPGRNNFLSKKKFLINSFFVLQKEVTSELFFIFYFNYCPFNSI